MDKYKKCLFVIGRNIISTLTQARFYVAILLVTCLMNQITYPIKMFSIQVGIKTYPWIFPFLTQVFYIQMIILVGIVFLFCDLPMINNGTIYILARTGKKIWFWAQVGYIFIMTFIYFLCIFMVSIILFLPHLQLGWGWGKVLGTLAQTNLADQLEIEIDYLLQVTYTPIQAIGMAFFIAWLVGVFVGVVILVLNIYFKSIVGAVAGTMIAFTPYMVANSNNMIAANYIAPAVWLNIMKSYQVESINYPNAWYIFSFLIMGIILLITLAYLKIRSEKYNYFKGVHN